MSLVYETVFTKQAGISTPIICGAMYPCSNPELVAAVSEAGALGIIQPLSLVFVHQHEFRPGLQFIKSLTKKPVGLNIIVEKSIKRYEDRMKEWLDIALEEGIRFFVTSLGSPRWVVEKAHGVGGIVYHDITDRKWAEKALSEGVDGLICVNDRAGGHAGTKSAEQLFRDLESCGKPLISAGGVGSPEEFAEHLKIGYAGVQMGTRFIAAKECSAHIDYKQAIVRAKSKDIVLSEKISGVPVAVINTPYIERTGTKAGAIAKRLLKGKKTKHLMRTFYAIRSLFQLKKANMQGSSYNDYWQAGKSVEHIDAILPVKSIVYLFTEAAHRG
jgi:nitronate monooxygenase